MTKDPYSGRLLANRYQLVELVGTGAMGQVYRAEDTLLGGVKVAVKFLSQTLLNKKMRERFEREATISALLGEKSMHIVKVRDYGIDENEIPFYVMEFLQGEGLSEIIKFNPLSLPRFLTVTRQICLGMECAHNGILFKGELCSIVHRDIKPSNIFVVNDPTVGELVKVLDFGIAKLTQSDESQTHSFMGTLAYCSPEQMEGKALDNRSDIYSLGVMMYEMLTNEMPILPETSSFGGWYKAHHEFPPEPLEPSLNLPTELEQLILKCLSKLPKDRPQNIAEILPVLESIERKSKIKKVEPKSKPVNLYISTQTTGYIEEICLQTSWPSDKPQKKIVFPRLINTPERVIATLWVMLEYQDILNRVRAIRYNQFLFLNSPHPMLLWITVLYNREHGPRWLPCYLDLKTESSQRVALTLAESGTYRILFFELERPEQCKHVLSSTIAPKQCSILKDWIKASKADNRPSEPQISKKRLRQEFEKLKPKILLKLEQGQNFTATDMSG